MVVKNWWRPEVKKVSCEPGQEKVKLQTGNLALRTEKTNVRPIAGACKY